VLELKSQRKLTIDANS